MSKKLIYIFLSFSLFIGKMQAQIAVQNLLTPAQVVQQVLLGSGVTASNIQYNGSALAATAVKPNVATYTCPLNPTFPIQNGILLTSGQAIVAIGPDSSPSLSNSAGTILVNDVDLTTLSNAGTSGAPTNGVVLEFDFTPSGNVISFKYIFGSEEYPEFLSFGDAFGFFLSGPGIAGTFANSAINLATLPGGANVSVPTVNNGGANAGPCVNCAYYAHNVGGLSYGTAIQYDGATVVLTATATVVCGQQYHIKLGVCNTGDQAWDTGVIIEAQSFSSPAVQVTTPTTINTNISNDSLTAERCETASFWLIRPPGSDTSIITLPYIVGGTATNGTDYVNIPSSVTFAVGVDSVLLVIDPNIDGITEGIETVTISIATITLCGDTVVSTSTVYIYDGPVLTLTANNANSCAGAQVTSTAVAGNGFSPYTYAWSSGQTTPGVTLNSSSVNPDTTYTVTATDACGYTQVQTVTVTSVSLPVIDSLLTYPSSGCGINDGVVQAFVSNVTTTPQQPVYLWTGPGAGSPSFIQASVWTNRPPGWYYFTITDVNTGCVAQDSALVTQNNVPVAAVLAVPVSGNQPLDVTFYNGSTGSNTYVWNFGNGVILPTTSTSSQAQTYMYGTYLVSLIASINGNCPDTAWVTITVDSLPPVLPLTWSMPNIFTPDGDNINEMFDVDSKNAKDIQLIIFNRWGEIMYDGSGLNPAWDGSFKGTPATDGTYFYKVKVYGMQSEIEEGQGFLQLSRK
jgi:gliding motility-associated-like protein